MRSSQSNAIDRPAAPGSWACPDPPGQAQRVSVDPHHDDLARGRIHARQRGDVHLVGDEHQRLAGAGLLGDQRAGGAGVLRFVFSSTAAVYGAPEVVPIPESHPLRPLSPYGRSKLMVEQCLADTSRATPLRYLAFRYFNAAGATPGRPERHNPETHLIPNVMRAARGEGGPLRVYGSDFDTHDGTAVRDYVHVADLAEAHRLGLEYLRAGGPSETLNLGTGTGHSVLDVVRAVERVTGRAVPVQPAPRRQGDPSRLVALADRAAAVLGWRPQVTALEDIVRSVDRYG